MKSNKPDKLKFRITVADEKKYLTQFYNLDAIISVGYRVNSVRQRVPAFQKLKMEYWGHDQVIFHDHDIRKEKGPFASLRKDKATRERFLEELSQVIENAPVKLVASVIDKTHLTERYATL